ncbi:MAG: TIGR02147 family protein [Xanthomonadaceae bacterium]|nr:TIGR02147 family protein [Xanthomonadaceae bacterium]
MDYSDYRQLLKLELEKRCSRNSRYSLRAFARDLGMGAARLSEVLNSRTGLSTEKAEQIAKRLELPGNEAEYFATLVESEHARSSILREAARSRLAKFKQSEFSSLEIDHFMIIAEWYHFAILELTELDGFKSNDRWIARRLGIQEIEVKMAVERLMRLEYLKRSRNRYVQTIDFVQVDSVVPSEALRKHHRQLISRALKSIDTQLIEQRDLGSMIMSFDKKDMKAVTKKIKSFRQEISQFASKSKNKNSVYCLNTQLFELTSA